MELFTKTLLLGLKRSLVCSKKKPCLHRKQALFAMQRSLVCKRGIIQCSQNALQAHLLNLFFFADNNILINFEHQILLCNPTQ